MTDEELDKIITWCKNRIKTEKREPFGLTGKKLEGYEDAMLQVMSYLHSEKRVDKMTDDEIVKALECCSKAKIYDDCNKMKCPLFLGLSMGCKYVDKENQLYSDALDLINRQKAAIEEMKETRVKNFETWKLLDRKTKQFYAERYEEAKEIVKAEAIKEFAERLKNKVIVDLSCGVDSADYLDDILFKNIDNLVKEMVGGKC